MYQVIARETSTRSCTYCEAINHPRQRGNLGAYMNETGRLMARTGHKRKTENKEGTAGSQRGEPDNPASDRTSRTNSAWRETPVLL